MRKQNSTDGMNQIQPDLKEAQRFLDLLAPGEEFTFQTFDDTPAKHQTLARVFHGHLDDYAETLTKLNQQSGGMGIPEHRDR